MTEPDLGSDVGSVGEEAMKLLRVLSSSSTTSGRDGAMPEGSAQPHAQSQTHGCSTSWCPVCQVADFVREHPEAIAGVAASAGSMMLALRDLFDAATPKDRS